MHNLPALKTVNNLVTSKAMPHITFLLQFKGKKVYRKSDLKLGKKLLAIALN